MVLQVLIAMISRAAGARPFHQVLHLLVLKTEWSNPCSAHFLTDMKLFLKGHLTPYARSLCVKGQFACVSCNLHPSLGGFLALPFPSSLSFLF